MKRQGRLVAIAAGLALVLVTLGSDYALAGPGGGTYYANSPAGGETGTALRKFVDRLPGLCGLVSWSTNSLGQCLPLATPTTVTVSGQDADYYEIGVKEYTEKMHSDLPKATRIRGYYQINTSGSASVNHYLGPVILATRDRPVRMKFVNNLPTGSAGDLFIPVDTTYMGAGPGPLMSDGVTTCDSSYQTCAYFSQNRTSLHLHGGNSPWISDGTPNQWITPAGDSTVYKKGVSQQNVPDMYFDNSGNLIQDGTSTLGATNDLGQGAESLYWTNEQTDRLMFYHDHAYGITRLNVYAGMAAGYLIVDPNEEGALQSAGVPGTIVTNSATGGLVSADLEHLIPLVIEDKTFVPQNIATQDAKWTNPAWGTYGDLWFPHVYETNQDPDSPDGANPYGRWDYGPWFWPPMDPSTLKGPLPEVSGVPEGFMDTPVINGTAYPYLDVQPRAYRIRILNAANDRFFNLQLYTADTSTGAYISPTTGYPTEVKMVDAVYNPLYPADWPTDGRAGGVPDPATAGPEMIQIGTESGLLPAPAVIPNQPVGYNYNRRDIVVLNVSTHALFLGPAERADVIVDFSQFAGKTVILYNDAPAPVPAFDTRNDYYTGDPDQSSTGGAQSTLPGYGPNTRTIMEFRVANTTPAAQFNLAALQTAWPAIYTAGNYPDPIIPEPAFDSVYNASFPAVYSHISDTQLTYTPFGSTLEVTRPITRKAIQELFTLDYGRMNATLGTELPLTNFFTQTTIPLGYLDPSTETVQQGETQFWKITHNGVDTHAIHFHLVDVQVINRVGWDGAIRPPDDNETGWKDTVRMNPLEDIVVAVRPKGQTLLPQALASAIPHSIRPLDPTQPIGGTMNFTNIDPYTNGAMITTNQVVDFGYEYVWHCHLLGHEENDMMRTIQYRIPSTVPTTPVDLTATAIASGVTLSWSAGAVDTDTNVAIGFHVTRDDGSGIYTLVADVPASPRTQLNTSTYQNDTTYPYPFRFTDTNVFSTATYTYQVTAYNARGDSTPAGPVSANTASWGIATGATITASPASPHNNLSGQVMFTAQGLGGQGAYDYQFLLTSGTTTTVQAFSSSNQWAWSTTGVTPGTYTVTVQVKNAGASGGAQAQGSMNYTILAGTPYSAVSPSVIAFGNQAINTTSNPQTVTVTNFGTGLMTFTSITISGPNANQFALASSTCGTSLAPATQCLVNLTTTPTSTGAKSATLNVNVASPATSQTVALSSTGIILPVSAVTVTASPVSPQIPGGIIKFTALATGGSVTPQYNFFWRNASGVWTNTGYSTSNVWNWNTAGLPVGTYYIEVRARNTGSTALYEALKDITFTLTASLTPVSTVTATPSPISPQVPGTTVAVTATAAGGSGTPEYNFFWRNPSTGVWTSTGYTLSGIWSWNTTSLPTGTYSIEVRARNSGSTALYEAVKDLSYTLVATMNPVSAVTATTSPVSPQVPGKTVAVTATASGGSGTPEYTFRWMNPASGIWTSAGYTTSRTWNWNTTGLSSGTYTIEVQARNAGSTAPYEALTDIPYTLIATMSPVSAVSATSDLASPQVAGTSITFTATAAGGSGTPEYSWWWKNPVSGVWSSTTYSTSNSWNWNTTGLPAGTYSIEVRARNSGSIAPYEAVKDFSYVLN